MKTILSTQILVMLLFIGCTSSYEDCFNHCGRTECDYNKVMQPIFNQNDSCNEKETILEHCYNRCRPR